MAWRILPKIAGNVGAVSTHVKMAAGAGSCSAFHLQNTHATQALYFDAGGETAVATTACLKLAAGESIYIPAILDPSNGIALIGSGAATTYVIQPYG